MATSGAPGVDSAEAGRIERLLDEANTLRRASIELQRESLAMQRAAIEAQAEVLAQTRRNLDAAQGVTERAAEIQARARRALMLILPVVLVLIAYVSWLLFFKLRI